MAEILLDTRLWNRVFKILKPALVVTVKAQKGTSKGKLIPTDCSLILNHKSDNNPGFFLECMMQHVGRELPGYSDLGKLNITKARALEGGISSEEIYEIEKAIIRAAIQERLLPETALYRGEHVAEQRQQQQQLFKSTQAFGFIYFVRNADIYKIGITDNLLRRMKELKPDEVLNSVRCSNYQEIERKMHAHFKKRRIPQTEYFRLDASEVEEAHGLMTEMADFQASSPSISANPS